MVRNVLCAAVVLLGAATRPAFAAESPMPTIDGDTKFWAYETAHSDEFDAAGAISAAKWTQELGEWKGARFVSILFFACVDMPSIFLYPFAAALYLFVCNQSPLIPFPRHRLFLFPVFYSR